MNPERNENYVKQFEELAEAIAQNVESYFEVGEECQEVCNELNVPFSVSEFPSDSFDTVMALAKLVEKNI